MRLTRSALVAAGASLALATACLNDRPLTPKDSAVLALRVALPAQVKQTVEIRVWYFPFGDTKVGALGVNDLFDQTYHTSSGFTKITAAFSLDACLSVNPPDALGPYCFVNVEATLRSDSTVVDRQTIYNLRVRPGVVTQADTLSLGVAPYNGPPLTDHKPTRGVLVGGGLMKYRLKGWMPDFLTNYDGLQGEVVEVYDSSGTLTHRTYYNFFATYDSVGVRPQPGLYAGVQSGTNTMFYVAQFYEERFGGLLSQPPDTAGVDQPDPSAPYMTFIQSDTSGGSFSSYVQWVAPSSTGMQSVDLVFRTPLNNAGGVVTDTIYQTCNNPVPDQSGGMSANCAVDPWLSNLPPGTPVVVVAVPIDSAGRWGQAIPCDFGSSCGGGIVVPDRRRRP